MQTELLTDLQPRRRHPCAHTDKPGDAACLRKPDIRTGLISTSKQHQQKRMQHAVRHRCCDTASVERLI